MFAGIKIKNLREQCHITRKELSILSDVPLRTLEDWESSKCEPHDINALHTIANILGCSLNDFCEEGSFLFTGENTLTINQVNQLVVTLNKQFNMLESSQKEIALNLLNKLSYYNTYTTVTSQN